MQQWKIQSCPHGDSRLKKKTNNIRTWSVQGEGMKVMRGDYFGTGVSANFFPPARPLQQTFLPPSVNFLILAHLKAEKYCHAILLCVPLLRGIIFPMLWRCCIFFYVNCHLYCLPISLLLVFAFFNMKLVLWNIICKYFSQFVTYYWLFATYSLFTQVFTPCSLKVIHSFGSYP